MKLMLTVVPTDQIVVIEVAPAIYNRAITGTAYFQDKIVELAKRELAGEAARVLRWNEIAIGQPGTARRPAPAPTARPPSA